MADYRELLRRAVDALPENNGTSRRAVYEKAREALVTQLRAIEPPLPAREITQHRLTLEDCIRQVEQEATESLLKGLKQETSVPPPPAPEKEEPQSESEPTKVEATTPVEATSDETAAEELETARREEAASRVAESVAAAQPVQEEPEVKKQPNPKPTPTAAVEETPIAEPKQEASDNSRTDDVAAALEDASAAQDEKAEEPVEEEHSSKAEPLGPEADKKHESDSEEKREDAPSSPTISPAEKLTAPKSVDEVIEEAQAASSAAAIVPPVVEKVKMPTARKSEPVAPFVEPALSSVREVEVDDSLPSNDISVERDEPQAAIDRAIQALDLEAEGKDATGLIASEGEGKAENETTTATDAAEDETDTPLDDEKEQSGGGLTVFLLLAIILLAGAGGGAYWAAREGYVDIEPLMAQLGLANQTDSVAVSTPIVEETPAPTETAGPTQSNVRNVTPASDNNSSTDTQPTEIAQTDAPAETAAVDDERLSEEPASDQPASEEVLAETPAEPNVAETPSTETIVVETPTQEPATNTDDRLTAEEVPTEQDQPQLNVADTTETLVEVGSRSLLIEEQITGSGGAVPFTGDTEWSRDVDELGAPVIKALVSIPARNLAVDVLFRKNGDPALPASHLIEVNFSVTDSFLGGGIASLPGILLKNEELAQGDPLVGASARIFDNSFLFALSAAEADLAKNVSLISERGWIDLPVVYSTGRKAIVTLEKGKEGGAIFEAVLAAWTAE